MDSDHPQIPPDDPASRRVPTAQLVLVAVLLALPVVALMWVSSYAKETPRLFGFPFFYWYQFMWVFIAAACTSIAYQVVAVHQRNRRDEEGSR